MSIDRRTFLKLALAAVSTPSLLASSGVQSATKTRFSAVVFDAFPVFDPRPIFGLAEQLFPGKGAELSNVWRTASATLRRTSPSWWNFTSRLAGWMFTSTAAG